MNKHFIASAIFATIGAFAFFPVSGALAASSTAPATELAKTPVAISMTVLTDESGGLKGPDGERHDTMIPANLVLHKGVPVTISVANYDDMPHTITAPGLKLNVVIKPGKEVDGKMVPTTTTFSFTPSAAGEFRWHCITPCDPWTMVKTFDGPDRDGFMAGYFVVL